MKQMSKPTRAQKEIISDHGLNPDNWVVAFESKDTLEIVSRRSAQRRVLQKGRKRSWTRRAISANIVVVVCGIIAALSILDL